MRRGRAQYTELGSASPMLSCHRHTAETMQLGAALMAHTGGACRCERFDLFGTHPDEVAIASVRPHQACAHRTGTTRKREDIDVSATLGCRSHESAGARWHVRAAGRWRTDSDEVAQAKDREQQCASGRAVAITAFMKPCWHVRSGGRGNCNDV